MNIAAHLKKERKVKCIELIFTEFYGEVLRNLVIIYEHLEGGRGGSVSVYINLLTCTFC